MRQLSWEIFPCPSKKWDKSSIPLSMSESDCGVCMPRTIHETSAAATVVIPQFNESQLTIQAIQSLRRWDSHRWPILVVDNGSSPESLRALHQLDDPETEILTLTQPGLTAAWNFAARHCRTKSLVFLNNDTLTTGPWVNALIAPLDSRQVGITGVEMRCELHLKPALELLAGWCFAVRRDTFHAVGGFDESMKLYFSDTDFQLRVREYDFGGSFAPWTVVPGLPISHLSHQTARRLPHRRSLWNADYTRFRTRWNRSH